MAKEYESAIEKRINKLTKTKILKKYQLAEIEKLSAPPSEADKSALVHKMAKIVEEYAAIVGKNDIAAGWSVDGPAEFAHLSAEDAKKAGILAKNYALFSAKQIMFDDFSSLEQKSEIMDFYKGDIERLSFKISLYNQFKKKSSGQENALDEVNRRIDSLTVTGKEVPQELLWAQKSLNNMVNIKKYLTDTNRHKNHLPKLSYHTRPAGRNRKGKGPREY